MAYKCKFCGYRFKNKDEQICPECFTARDADISCDTFSKQENSHERIDDRFFRGDDLFTRNDTFKEEENEFLKEERQEESHTNASRYESMERKQAARQNTRTNYIPNQTAAPFPNSSNVGSGTGSSANRSTSASDPFRVYNNTQRSYTRPNYRPQTGSRTATFGGSSYNGTSARQINQQVSQKGCATALILFIVFSTLITIVPFIIISSVTDDGDTGSSNSTVVSEESEVSEKSAKEYGFFSSAEGESYFLTNDKEHYEVTLENYMGDIYENSSMPEEESRNLLVTDDEGYLTSYDERYDKPLYFISANINVDGTEPASFDYYSITDIHCEAYDENNALVSSYTGVYQDIMPVTTGSDEHDLTIQPVLYFAADSERLEVTVNVSSMNENREFTFIIDNY